MGRKEVHLLRSIANNGDKRIGNNLQLYDRARLKRFGSGGPIKFGQKCSNARSSRYKLKASSI